MQIGIRGTAIATAIVACATLLSFSWSERGGGSEVFAAAVAATTSPWNYHDYYCYDAAYAGNAGSRAPRPGYYGSYCVSSSNITGLYARPTLFPRFYFGLELGPASSGFHARILLAPGTEPWTHSFL